MRKAQLILCKNDIQSANLLYLHNFDFLKTNKMLVFGFQEKKYILQFYCGVCAGQIIFSVSDAAVSLCLIENCVHAHVCVCERGRETVYHFIRSVTSRWDWLAFQVTKNNQTKRPKIQCMYFSYPFYLLHSESFQTRTFTIEFFDESKLTMSVKQQFDISPFLPFLPVNL